MSDIRVTVSANPVTVSVPQGATGPHGDQGPGGPVGGLTYATVADLEAATVPTDGTLAYVRGYASANDGGQGYYRYDSGSSATVDHGLVATAAGGTGRWLRQYSEYINVRWFGATGDGSTDDTTAIQAALTAAGTSHVIVYFPAGTYKWTGTLSVPTNVVIAGHGIDATTFRATAASDQIKFGSRGVAGYVGGGSGGFTVDGNSIATTPLYFGRQSERSYRDIKVTASAGDGVLLEECQNARFLNFSSSSNAGSGIVLDYGAGGNVFFGAEFNDNGAYAVKFLGTAGYNSTATPCAQNFFYGCILERNTAVGLIYHGAGTNNGFINCTLSMTGLSTGLPLVTARVDGSLVSTWLRFDSCYWNGDVTHSTGIDGVGAVSIIMEGVNVANNLLRWFYIDDTCAANLRIGGPLVYPNSTLFVTQGGADSADQAIRIRTTNPSQITRTATTDNLMQGYISGESNPRFRILADGGIGWSSGSANFDTILYRSAANVLRTGDKFIADLGLGVGNSAAATTLGSVAKKIQVFDQNGNSLGYLPVYDAIT